MLRELGGATGTANAAGLRTLREDGDVVGLGTPREVGDAAGSRDSEAPGTPRGRDAVWGSGLLRGWGTEEPETLRWLGTLREVWDSEKARDTAEVGR